jgi:hypothetical protein
MTSYTWQFSPRFRHKAFDWKSDKPIQRIKAALAEIKQAANKGSVLTAKGAALIGSNLAMSSCSCR